MMKGLKVDIYKLVGNISNKKKKKLVGNMCLGGVSICTLVESV